MVHFEKKHHGGKLSSPYRNTTAEFEDSKYQIIQVLFHCHGVFTPNFCSASFGSKISIKKNHTPNISVKILVFSGLQDFGS